MLVERINDADGKVISGGFCKEREREKGCKLELEKGYISVVVQHVIHRKGYVYVAVGLKLVGKNNVYVRPVASQWHAFKPMPLCTQQLEMEKRTKKKKRKRKRSGRKGRVHRGVPTFPQHNAASFLHMPAGGCRLNRQGCTLCVCPRGFRPYLYSSSSLQSLSTRFGEKNKIEVVFQNFNCKTGFPPNLLPGGDTRYCLSCVV